MMKIKTSTAKLLTENVGRLFNDLLNPDQTINPLKVRNEALRIAKQFKFDAKQTKDFVNLSLTARREIYHNLNKPYNAFIDRDTTLVVNLREATNQTIKRSIVKYLKDAKKPSFKKLEHLFSQAFAGAVKKQQADFDALLSNKVNSLISNLRAETMDIADIIREYSPFGRKATENLAVLVEHENWSLLGMVLVAMESTFQAFNRLGFNINNRLKRKIFAKFFKVSSVTGISLVKRKNGKLIRHHSESDFAQLFHEVKFDLHNRERTRRKVTDATLNYIVNELESLKVLRTETNQKHLKTGSQVYELFEKAIDYEGD